jgi:hypothetical protein
VAVQEYDEEGNSHGPIELNTTMKIVFQAPDQTCRSAVFQIKNGNNVLSYVWEDLSPIRHCRYLLTLQKFREFIR